MLAQYLARTGSIMHDDPSVADRVWSFRRGSVCGATARGSSGSTKIRERARTVSAGGVAARANRFRGTSSPRTTLHLVLRTRVHRYKRPELSSRTRIDCPILRRPGCVQLFFAGRRIRRDTGKLTCSDLPHALDRSSAPHRVRGRHDLPSRPSGAGMHFWITTRASRSRRPPGMKAASRHAAHVRRRLVAEGSTARTVADRRRADPSIRPQMAYLQRCTRARRAVVPRVLRRGADCLPSMAGNRQHSIRNRTPRFSARRMVKGLVRTITRPQRVMQRSALGAETPNAQCPTPNSNAQPQNRRDRAGIVAVSCSN